MIHAMKKRPYCKTRDKVLAAFDAKPTISSYALARKLKLHPAYIRKTLSRNGRVLARAVPKFS